MQLFLPLSYDEAWKRSPKDCGDNCHRVTTQLQLMIIIIIIIIIILLTVFETSPTLLVGVFHSTPFDPR